VSDLPVVSLSQAEWTALYPVVQDRVRFDERPPGAVVQIAIAERPTQLCFLTQPR
jgi:hypothetical protein